MQKEERSLRWGEERRLEFIEFRLGWEGGVRRGDIRSLFGVSEPQASKDLTEYQKRAPNNAIYDASAKRYVASPSFVIKHIANQQRRVNEKSPQIEESPKNRDTPQLVLHQDHGI